MTGNINPINVNTQGVGGQYFGTGAKGTKKEETKENEQPTTATKQPSVSADDVFKFMAQSSVAVVPTKVVDPSKYVDAESEARIAALMGSFEDKVAEGLLAFNAEFKGADVSENAKMAVVLKQINKEV